VFAISDVVTEGVGYTIFGEGRGRNCMHPLNFSLSDNVLLVGKFSFKSAQFGLKVLHFGGNLGAKLNFKAPIIYFQLLARTFVTHDAAVR